VTCSGAGVSRRVCTDTRELGHYCMVTCIGVNREELMCVLRTDTRELGHHKAPEFGTVSIFGRQREAGATAGDLLSKSSSKDAQQPQHKYVGCSCLPCIAHSLCRQSKVGRLRSGDKRFVFNIVSNARLSGPTAPFDYRRADRDVVVQWRLEES